MFRAFFLALLAVLALGTASVSAQPRRAPDVQPLDRVLPQVRSRYPGTFYDADGPFMDEGGNPHYRLKWMTPEGRVMWLDTDARTGRVLGVEHGGARGGARRYNAPPPDAPPPPGYFENGPRGRFEGGYPGGNPYRGNDRWEHGPDGRDRNWNGGGNWNGRGNWNGGGHGNWGGNHGGHGGGHGHGHGH